MRTDILATILFSLFIFACERTNEEEENQVDQANNEELRQLPTSTEEIVSDSTLTGDEISSQTEEALSSTVNLDLPTNSSLGFSLTADNENSLDEKRNCTVVDASEDDEGHTLVQISRDRVKSFSKSFKDWSIGAEVTRSLSINRRWTAPADAVGEDAVINCNKEGTHIALSPEKFEGVSMQANFEKTFTNQITRTKADETRTRVLRGSVTGTRNVSFLEVDSSEDSNTVTVLKEVKFDLVRSIFLGVKINAGSTDKSQDAPESPSLKTDPDAPLMVQVSRDKKTREWTERKIISGKTIGTNKDGGRLELSFENLVFTFEGECKAASGNIYGEIYSKNAELLKSFQIDFSLENPIITYSDNTSAVLRIDDCDLARAAKKKIKRAVNFRPLRDLIK